jgi:hypothetical protein
VLSNKITPKSLAALFTPVPAGAGDVGRLLGELDEMLGDG